MTSSGTRGGVGVPKSPADAAAGPSLALTTGGSSANALSTGVVDPDLTPLPRQLSVLDSDLQSLLGR
eukprot:1593041-Ditylum_brightwellii.AAC.1